MPITYFCDVIQIHYSSFKFLIMATLTVTQSAKASGIKTKTNLQAERAKIANNTLPYFEAELAAEKAKATPNADVVETLENEVKSRQDRIVKIDELVPQYDAYIALLV